MKNKEELLLYFSADESRLNFLEPILPVFATQLNDTIESLTLAQRTKDNQLFSSLIHKLKGSALTYGATPISKEIEVIEKNLDIGKPMESIKLAPLLSEAELLNKICPQSV